MNSENRRPLKARSWAIMQNAASWLDDRNVTPNQISIASIGFSALAAVFLILISIAFGGFLWACVIMVLLCLSARGFCNILDGLVAVEGGKATPSGEMFNDIPDRISDAVIFIGAGYGAGVPALGWLAALLSVMTAYVRTLGRGLGAPSDFSGPMAKLHRMLILAAACGLTLFDAGLGGKGFILSVALLIVSAGCGFTIWKRAKATYDYLEGQSAKNGAPDA